MRYCAWILGLASLIGWGGTVAYPDALPDGRVPRKSIPVSSAPLKQNDDSAVPDGLIIDGSQPKLAWTGQRLAFYQRFLDVLNEKPVWIYYPPITIKSQLYDFVRGPSEDIAGKMAFTEKGVRQLQQLMHACYCVQERGGLLSIVKVEDLFDPARLKKWRKLYEDGHPIQQVGIVDGTGKIRGQWKNFHPGKAAASSIIEEMVGPLKGDEAPFLRPYANRYASRIYSVDTGKRTQGELLGYLVDAYSELREGSDRRGGMLRLVKFFKIRECDVPPMLCLLETGLADASKVKAATLQNLKRTTNLPPPLYFILPDEGVGYLSAQVVLDNNLQAADEGTIRYFFAPLWVSGFNVSSFPLPDSP